MFSIVCFLLYFFYCLRVRFYTPFPSLIGSSGDKEPSAILNEDDEESSSKPFRYVSFNRSKLHNVNVVQIERISDLSSIRWSIDQLAILYPADIDITDKEVSKQEIYRTPDVEYEKKVSDALCRTGLTL